MMLTKLPATRASLASLALSLLTLLPSAQAVVDPVLRADPAAQPASQTLAVKQFQKQLRLPAPAALSPNEAETTLKGRLQIGVRRNFNQPAKVTRSTVTQAEWITLPDGSRMWTADVISDQAAGLRVHARNVHLPEGASLIVYPPSGGESGSMITSQELGKADEVWLPTVRGEEAIVECRLQPGVDPAEVTFELDGISHLYETPQSFALKAGSCNNDVSCFGGWANQAAAVGRISYVENGNAYLCSGSLLSGADPVAAARLFLTANHCVPNQAVASTVEVYWFFQTSSCGAAPPSLSDATRTTGGAEFLAGSGASDFALLRLRASPPGGTFYVQWTTELPSIGEAVTTIHHPGGSFKRISFGGISSQDPNFTRVRWSSGVTEPGSSGAPLFNSRQQLIGQLYGGSSSCANPSGTDSFGRFDQSYTAMRQWLEPNPSTVQEIKVTMPRARYSGLFQKSDGFSPATSGTISFTTGTRNIFSGNVRMVSGVHPFVGRFDASGSASVAVKRGGWPTLTLKLQADPSNFSVISGTIREPSWTANVTANRLVYNGTSQSAPQSGRFTLALMNAAGNVPGVAVSTVSRAGVVSLVAKMPGVGTWSQSGSISGNGDYPLFVNLGSGRQVISGWINFGAGYWAAPSGSLSSARNGEVSSISVEGSRYSTPPASSPVLSGTSVGVVLSGQGLSSDLNYALNLGTRRAGSTTNSSRGRISISFASNGIFSGRATDPAAPGGLPFVGVVLQNSSTGIGYYQSSSALGTVRLNSF